jgi:Fur family ferric uptake transcriptional regulator
MTVAPQVDALPVDDLEAAVAALRRRGLRVSIARRLVLELLFAAGGPVSAEHVASQLTIDAASVYRNLEMLERHGLVHHVHLGHGPGLYVLVGRRESEYLYCDRCATVDAVAPERLDPVRAELRRTFGYAVRFTHFPLVGLCPACAAAAGTAGEGALGGAPSSAGSGAGGVGRAPVDAGGERASGHEHDHSHGDLVHSHPHVHGGEGHRHDH